MVGSQARHHDAGRSHGKMKVRFIRTVLGLIGAAVVVAAFAYVATFSITTIAAIIGLKTKVYWFMQPVSLFCTIGIPFVSGWMMARLASQPRLWLGILPIVILWIGESVAFYSMPCPACHSFETFSGIGGAVFSLPAGAAGWWLTYWITGRRCEHPPAN
jgi:hypothetical protein